MTMQTGRGWMPGVDQRVSPNITKGRAGLKIRAGVIHIMDGGYAGSIEWLCNPNSGVSAHFAVAKDGRITQMVNIFDTAYANGLSWNTLRNSWIDPDGNAVKPPWKGLIVPVNPNLVTVSIEHEGLRGTAWTPAMYEADRKILLYIQSQQQITFIPHDTLIGHNEISPVARVYCPGSGVDLAKMAASVAAVPDFSALWGSHFHYFSESAIAGAWRDNAAALGPATSDEDGDAEGKIWRRFRSGAISFDPGTGKTVVYVPRKQ